MPLLAPRSTARHLRMPDAGIASALARVEALTGKGAHRVDVEENVGGESCAEVEPRKACPRTPTSRPSTPQRHTLCETGSRGCGRPGAHRRKDPRTAPRRSSERERARGRASERAREEKDSARQRQRETKATSVRSNLGARKPRNSKRVFRTHPHPGDARHMCARGLHSPSAQGSHESESMSKSHSTAGQQEVLVGVIAGERGKLL
eukprot:646847-Rhodomonas_salina.2